MCFPALTFLRKFLGIAYSNEKGNYHLVKSEQEGKFERVGTYIFGFLYSVSTDLENVTARVVLR